jgi:hypothetical protein
MVKQGWAYESLMAMPARTFGFWFQTQIGLAEAEAEAVREAQEKAGS